MHAAMAIPADMHHFVVIVIGVNDRFPFDLSIDGLTGILVYNAPTISR